MPELTIPEKLLPLVAKDKRFKVVIGGRGGAKSQTVADLLIGAVAQFGHKVACGREFQNSIEDSVHSLVSAEIERLQAPGFDVQATRINHANGGGFIYKGLARNPESIKSMHGVNVAWIEEAQTLSEESLKKLTPTVRESGSELWFTGNPRYSNDPFSQRFIKPWEAELFRDGYYEDDLHLVILVNYYDNPWFPPELEQERRWDYENTPRAKYNHVWLGHYDDTVENAIILPEWFDAAVDAHLKLKIEPRGAEIVSHDPSDMGADAKGIAYRHGIVIKDAKFQDFADVNAGCDWALSYAIDKRADQFIWDGDGMGVALRRQIGDALNGRQMRPNMFQGSNSVDFPDAIYEDINEFGKKKTNKETFRNKRAQYYWGLRDRFKATHLAVTTGKYTDPDTLISISSGIESLDVLRSELCRIPLKPNSSGLIQILSKQEMRKLGIQSPNMADSVMMSFASHAQQAHTQARPVVRKSTKGWT